MGEVVRLSPRHIREMAETNSAIASMNQKLIRMRQMNLMKALQESTTVRVEILQKIKKWIDLIEQRIFAPDVIMNMDLNKVMALFRFVGQFSLKLLAQMNDIEGLMKTYIETSNNLAALRKDSSTGIKRPEEVNDIKKEIMKHFVDALNKNVEDAEIKEAEKNENAIEVKSKVEQTKLENETEERLEFLDEKLKKELDDL